MTEVEQPPQNGIDPTAGEDDENSKARPADIEQVYILAVVILEEKQIKT